MRELGQMDRKMMLRADYGTKKTSTENKRGEHGYEAKDKTKQTQAWQQLGT